MPGPEPREERVLVLAPTGRDSRLIVDALGWRGLTAFVCADLGHLCQEVRQGAGAALLAEEALLPSELRVLVDTLQGQPPWSDLPLLILTGKGTPSRASVERFRQLEPVANVAQLERPARVRTLVSAVQAALRARRRQYDVRDHLDERERLARELGQQAAKLVETDRQKDEFLATLAHELRNPLAPVRNALQIMSLAADNRHAVDQSRAMVERQVRHMVRLVDDLLDVSRITRGKLELQKERVALSWVMATAVETSRPLIDAARHVLNVSLPSEALELDADATRVSQVISNLLNNAAKYTDPGGRIWLSGGRNGDFAVVRVRDTGIGISAEMLPRIFDMFMQADHSVIRSQGGLGVGLSLVRTLVKMHGGTVEVHSAGSGRGSEFTVRLPLAAPRGTNSSAGTDTDGVSPPPSPHRVLIVDDNADAAESLAMLLRMLGQDVRTAGDGGTALETARAYRPDVAFLDIGLPGMNGHDLARAIRSQPWGEQILLVAVTGWGQEDDRRRSREAGFNHHLTKPADPRVLQHLLQEMR